MPALFLVGSLSAERASAVMRSLEPHMPRTQWATFEGHAHAANLMAPAGFAETVLGFLSE